MSDKRSSRQGPAARKGAVQNAADRVRRSILSGEFEAGEDLPGERDLSDRLGVSRLTLRSALARLEAEGLVQPVHGSGTKVLDFRRHGSIGLIGYLVAQEIEGGVIPIELLSDLLELRRTFAIEILSLVTERASPDQVVEMRAHIAKQRGLIHDPEAYTEADLGFARLMVRASGNLAMELLFNTVAGLIADHPGLALAFRANADETLSVYGRLLDLIEDGDPQRVAKVARRVLQSLDRTTLQRIALLTEANKETNE
ncbi:MAG: GntR family transcriptional regulator [Myxococcota bacterium]